MKMRATTNADFARHRHGLARALVTEASCCTETACRCTNLKTVVEKFKPDPLRDDMMGTGVEKPTS